MKYLKRLLIIMLVFIPITVLAENTYYGLDIKIEKVDDEKIADSSTKIYAQTEASEEKLTDHTNDFAKVEVTWSVCSANDCKNTTEVEEDAVFEKEKDYVILVKIKANDNETINEIAIDKIKYNGTPIEELSGEIINKGNELLIKTRTSAKIEEEEASEEVEPTATPEPKNEETKEEGNKCILGLSFCCNEFVGLSICIWILIIIVLIIIIVSIFMYRAKKKTDEQLANL